MATDGASCEPDFSRAPEDAAGATAEAAVTEVPGWARGGCRRGPGLRLHRACPPGAFRKPRLPGVPPPHGASRPEPGSRRVRRLPGLRIPSCPFPALREAVPVRSVLGAPCVRPERPLRPLPRLRRGLARGGGWGVFVSELDPHCSPPAVRVIEGSCLGAAWHLSADPGRRLGGDGLSPGRCGDAHCVCVFLCLRPLERGSVPGCGRCCPPLRVGALGSSCLLPRHLVRGGKVSSFFPRRCARWRARWRFST